MSQDPQLSLPYIAGIFDGEGCIDITKDLRHGSGGWLLRAKITNSSLKVLKEIQKQFGGRLHQIHGENYHSAGGSVSRVAVWDLTWRGSQATSLLWMLWPFIRIKEAQLSVALAFSRFNSGRDRSLRCEFRRGPDGEKRWYRTTVANRQCERFKKALVLQKRAVRPSKALGLKRTLKTRRLMEAVAGRAARSTQILAVWPRKAPSRVR